MSSATPAPSARPRSDVSNAVGLVGVAGLFAWVMVCRNWAAIAEALALPGPRAPMSGPYAAVATLLFTSVPMILWSLLVDKVHRRPSTGIDWTRPRRWRDVHSVSFTKLAGLWATWAAIGFFYCVARWYWDGQYLFAMKVIGTFAAPLFLLSVPYVLWLDRFLLEPRDSAWHFGAMLIGREAWDGEQVAKHWRAWAIKGFFTAFMISILPPGFAIVVEADYSAAAGDPVHLAQVLIETLFLIDVQIGTVGYLLTLRPLDAHIRSGNPLLAGWVAALLCYPPFVWGTMGRADVMGYEAATGGWAHWLAGSAPLLWAWAALLVSLTAIYAWATFAFGIRFSNLTYRGVITHGPYRLTRHPAYLSKNLFWWCSTLPFLVTNGSFTDMVRNTVMLTLVSGIYYWRARTEEAHLLAEDPKYAAYHRWMARHAPITRVLNAMAGSLRPRQPVPQPAE
ncbi:methyltransferase family protein [Novosphingobium sp. M1R2S20]|uniref:Isoprenylcysteine carboxylmethyltransferase family protein n=1 Tax=Novosphingobium rhizovicinum TaxID=3228928 RepID=A0ABV3RAD1_9SPHN